MGGRSGLTGPPRQAGCTRRAETKVEDSGVAGVAARRGGPTGQRRPPASSMPEANPIAPWRDAHQARPQARPARAKARAQRQSIVTALPTRRLKGDSVEHSGIGRAAKNWHHMPVPRHWDAHPQNIYRSKSNRRTPTQSTSSPTPADSGRYLRGGTVFGTLAHPRFSHQLVWRGGMSTRNI